jgi:filamentous hemagglutinin
MNKHCFRLIFSKVHGFLIPVAETKNAQRKSGQVQQQAVEGHVQEPHHCTLKALPAIISWLNRAWMSVVLCGNGFSRGATAAMLLTVPGYVAAQLAVDPSSAGTSITESINKVPVINITNPGSDGLSHNRFTEFNVHKPGLIFNNSKEDGISQIGGGLMKNPGLTQHATAILSEVTGNNPSYLEGTMEVFGQRADIIIANPNGVSINGVTTLNSNSLAVTTGWVQNNNGNLQFVVDERSGRVTVGSGGVDTSGLSYFDIVARAVTLNGAVGSAAAATDISVTAGLNTYDAKTRTHIKNAGTGANAPVVAIQGDLAGAMYGRMISLVSTETGAGVRHEGLIKAAKDITITADGDIVLASTLAEGNITVASSSRGVVIGTEAGGSGMSAQGHIDLAAKNGIVIRSDVSGNTFAAAAESLLIQAATLAAKGNNLAGNIKAVRINVGTFTLSGEIEAYALRGGLTVKVDPSYPLVLRGGKLMIQMAPGVYEEAVLKSTGMLLSGGGIDIAANAFINDEGILKDTSTRGIKITADTLRNTGLSQTQGDLELVAEVLDNLCTVGIVADGKEQHVCGGFFGAGNASIKAGKLNNAGGLSVAGHMTLELGDGAHTNQNDASITGLAGLLLKQVAGKKAHLQNSGEVLSGGELLLILDSLSAAATSGISSYGDSTIQVTSTLINEGRLTSSSNLTVTAQDMTSESTAVIYSRGKVDITTQGSQTYKAKSTLFSQGDLHMRAGGNITHQASQVDVRGDRITVHADGDLVNDGGAFSGAKQMSLSAGKELRNVNGSIISATEKLTLKSGADMVNSGQSYVYVDEGGIADITVGGSLYNSGLDSFFDASTLTFDIGKSFFNTAGAWANGKNSLTIRAKEDMSNSGVGSALTGTNVTIAARSVSNVDQARINAEKAMKLDATSWITNDSFANMIAERVDINAGSSFTTGTGGMLKGKNVWVTADSFIGNGGAILTSDHLELTTFNYTNTANLASQNTATLNVTNGSDRLLKITNGNFTPKAANRLTLNTDYLENNGSINNPGEIRINALFNVKNNGEIITGKSLSVLAGGSIDNMEGKLIWAAEDVVLDSRTALTNWRNGLIMAMGNVTLVSDTVIRNNVGRIEAGKTLRADAPLFENLSEATGGPVKVSEAKEDTWYTEASGLEVDYWNTKITLPVYTSDLTVKQGVVKAGGDILFNQGEAKNTKATVRNVGGLIAAAGNLTVNGNLENKGVSTSKNLTQLLIEAQTTTQYMTSSFIHHDGVPVNQALYALMEGLFGSTYLGYGYEWVNSFKEIKTPDAMKLISAVLGADWKALSQDDLKTRWAAHKASPRKTMLFYADTQAEISAGKAFTVDKDSGAFSNGDGAKWAENKAIDVKVGDETVQTIDGDFNTAYNPGDSSAIDKIKQDIMDNPMFKPNPIPPTGELPNVEGDMPGAIVPGGFSPIYPLYETRIEYLDLSKFYGSQYFFDRIGYNPNKTVTVMGDAYFDHELIVRSVEKTVGNFFAVANQLSGTDLVKKLMDNAAGEASGLGLVLGQPLTAEQIGKLTSDIVWYETTVVNGVSVLAPRVYISPKTMAERNKDQGASAVVTAQNVLIDATSVNNINGVIRGQENTLVFSNTDINNVSTGGASAGIHGGDQGRVVVAAEGSVLNQGGTVGGYQQTIVGGNGVTSTTTTGYDENGNLVSRNNGVMGAGTTAEGSANKAAALKKQREDKLAAEKAVAANPPSTTPETAASQDSIAEKPKLVVEKPDVRAIFEELKAAAPVAVGAGSSVTVISGGNINLIGANTVADNVKLQSTGDLNMKDVHEVKSNFENSVESGFLAIQQTNVTTSEAISKGNQVKANDLTIVTGGNWNVTGSDVNTQSSDVKVAGDTTVAAGKDLAFYEKEQKTTQLVFGAAAGSNGHEASTEKSRFDTQQSASGTKASEYSDMDLNEDAGAIAGANKNRGDTVGTRYRYGIEVIETKETKQEKNHHNSQLNLGSGTMDVGGTFDLGGADINKQHQLSPQERAKMTAEEKAKAVAQMPTLDITAGDITSTKFVDTSKHTFSREETFIGASHETHSSVANVVSNVNKTADKAADGMEVDGALTAGAQVGNITQVVFGDLAGTSMNYGVKNTQSKSESSTTAENINQIGGNISLKTTKGDIVLNGVNIQGGKVELDSAGKIHQQAAQSTSNSSSSTDMHNAGVGVSGSVSPIGAGIGLSAGADGNYDRTTESSTSHTNGLISGAEVSIKAKGDHNMEGANIKADQLAYDIGGNQTITSKQDSVNMKHERGSWSASAGVALSSAGGVIPTGGASASGGKDYDNSKLTTEQSGISAGSMNFHVGGNQSLTGAHIINSSGQGSYRVDGTTTAATLTDSRDKDGGYGGGGGGISKSGLPTVFVEAGRVDQVKYEANQKATVDLGGMEMNVGQGVIGDLNKDADKTLEVITDKKVAGTDIKIEISLGDLKKKKKPTNATPPVDGDNHAPSNPPPITSRPDPGSMPVQDGPTVTPPAGQPKPPSALPPVDGGTKPAVQPPTITKPNPVSGAKPPVDGNTMPAAQPPTITRPGTSNSTVANGPTTIIDTPDGVGIKPSTPDTTTVTRPSGPSNTTIVTGPSTNIDTPDGVGIKPSTPDTTTVTRPSGPSDTTIATGPTPNIDTPDGVAINPPAPGSTVVSKPENSSITTLPNGVTTTKPTPPTHWEVHIPTHVQTSVGSSTGDTSHSSTPREPSKPHNFGDTQPSPNKAPENIGSKTESVKHWDVKGSRPVRTSIGSSTGDTSFTAPPTNHLIPHNFGNTRNSDSSSTPKSKSDNNLKGQRQQ